MCSPDLVRPGCPRDVAAAVAIDVLVSSSPWRAASLQRYFDGDAGTNSLVLEQGGNPRAFLIYSLVLDQASVDNIAVHPDSQGCGMGRRLLDAVLERMRRSGVKRCVLEVRQSNGAALALYESSGFCVDGHRRGYYKTPQGREDALLMSRRL